MCEFCGESGICIVCGYNHDLQRLADNSSRGVFTEKQPMLRWDDWVSKSMPETATYSHRAWEWVPSDRAGEDLAEDGHGVLGIELVRRSGGKVEKASYTVTELEAMPGLLGRRFRLQPRHQDDREPYTVTLGGTPSCTCPAGQTRAKERVLCPKCDGSGRAIVTAASDMSVAALESGAAEEVPPCPECKGEGTVGSICKHLDAMTAIEKEGLIKGTK